MIAADAPDQALQAHHARGPSTLVEASTWIEAGAGVLDLGVRVSA